MLVFSLLSTCATASLPSYLDKLRYQQGEVINKKEMLEESRRRIVLSPVKRINNAMVIENQAYLTGRLSSVMIDAGRDASLEEVYDYYFKLVNSLGEIRYTCEKRECGINNYWANQIFSEHKLVGRDSNQYYIAARLTLDGRKFMASVYLVTNSLRNTMIYIELFALSSSDLQTKSGWEQGYLLNDVTRDTQLIDVLRSLSDVRQVFVVSYANNGMTPDLAEKKQRLGTLNVIKGWLVESLTEGIEVSTFDVGGFHVEQEAHKQKVWYRIFVY